MHNAGYSLRMVKKLSFIKIKRPIGYQWLILASLIFFSLVPILILEFVQVITVPGQLEQREIKISENELNVVADSIQNSLFEDANRLVLLAENEHIVQFLKNNASQEYLDRAIEVMTDYINISSRLASLPLGVNKHTILEVGLDLIESFHPSKDTISDQLTRLATTTIDFNSKTYVTSGEQNILNLQNYYPYLQIKLFYPDKEHYSSSIRQMTNFLNQEAIRDENQNPVPVIVHSRLIKDADDYVGCLYSVVYADWILELVDELNDQDKPAILTNRNGSVFYSNQILTFTEVTGYYETILDAGFDTTFTDRNGFEGEITIYRQIAIDIEQNQSLLIAKVLPRNTILSSFQRALIQAILTIILSTALATLLAYFTSNTITKRIRKVTQAVDKITEGDFGVDLDLSGTDELAKLSQSFDRMTKRLKIYINEEEE
jgi:HAMP domain-containing protein